MRRRPDAGYSLLEATILIPVIVVMTLIIVQYALVWHARHVAEAAAREGYRAAAAYQSTGEIGRRAASSYMAQVAPGLVTDVHVDTHVDATEAQVDVQGDVLPLLSFGHFAVHESAGGPVQHFVAPAG